MRAAFFLAIIGMLGLAQSKLDKRYGIEAETDAFSQKTPQKALESILKAVQLKKVDYVVAHLADPSWVDSRVQEVHGGNFADMVKETSAQLADNPDTVKMFRRFLKEGEWDEKSGTVKLKDVKDGLYFKKVEERWFLENRKKAGGEPKEKEKEKEKEKDS